jgi:hypothetical protein
MRYGLTVAGLLGALLGLVGCGDDGGGGGSCAFCERSTMLCSGDSGITVEDCRCSETPDSVNECAMGAESCSDVLSCAAGGS